MNMKALQSNVSYHLGVGICLGAVALGVMARYPLMAIFKGVTSKSIEKEESKRESSNYISGEDESSISSEITTPISGSERHMVEACRLATENLQKNTGGPFGCVIVRDGKIIGEGANSVTTSKDPTCHAEMNAIRNACKNVDDFVLDGAICFTSCEPCPMCYAALRWARVDRIFYANTRKDAHNIGFSDQDIYDEIEQSNQKMERLDVDEAKVAFKMWHEDKKFVRY